MVRVQLLIVALTAVFLSAPMAAARSGILRQPVDKYLDVHPFFRRGWTGVLCVAEVSEILEQHEGRRKCAYDHESGFRAVGVGYNLDDDVETRKSELSAALADYEKVYKGESCLNNLQISGLLLLDSKRALDRAEKNVKPLNDFCCSVQAVFADIQHSAGAVEDFPREDLERVVEKAALKEYKNAAKALEKTEWCSKKVNEERCDDNLKRVKEGC